MWKVTGKSTQCFQEQKLIFHNGAHPRTVKLHKSCVNLKVPLIFGLAIQKCACKFYPKLIPILFQEKAKQVSNVVVEILKSNITRRYIPEI